MPAGSRAAKGKFGQGPEKIVAGSQGKQEHVRNNKPSGPITSALHRLAASYLRLQTQPAMNTF